VRQCLPLFGGQILHLKCLVDAGIVPFAVLVVKAFCGRTVRGHSFAPAEAYQKIITDRFAHASDNINCCPAMSSGYPRIRAAFENGSEHITVFLTLRAPRGRELLKNAVVGKTVWKNIISWLVGGRNNGRSSKRLFVQVRARSRRRVRITHTRCVTEKFMQCIRRRNKNRFE
jgi:hypothetical protein